MFSKYVDLVYPESQCSLPVDSSPHHILFSGQPFKIVTGKGSHSANKVAVLKPAIKNALVEDGWTVGTWDAGLVVRGRNS